LVGRRRQRSSGSFPAAGEESAEAATEPVQILRLDAVVGDPLRPQQLGVELGPCIGARRSERSGRRDRPLALRRLGGGFQHFDVSRRPLFDRGLKLLSAINET
jgi:hypothetical protein